MDNSARAVTRGFLGAYPDQISIVFFGFIPVHIQQPCLNDSGLSQPFKVLCLGGHFVPLELQDRVLYFTFVTSGIVAATIVIGKLLKRPNLDAIPTVGSSNWLESWRAGQNFQSNAMEVVQEGYEKYHGAPFKVADRYRWLVFVGSQQNIEELRMASKDVLSFDEEVREIMKTEYTLGPELLQSSYHVEVIRSHLTRNLGALYPAIRDEVCVAFDEVLDLRDNEWKSIRALGAIQQVACRVGNRVFVGLPLCRDLDWINLILRYMRDVVEGANEMRRYPSFLSPLIARFKTDFPETTKRAMKHLEPIIEERLKHLEQHGGDAADRSNDLISWLLDNAPGDSERTVRLLTVRIMTINFAAIHTSANSFCQTLFLLAEHPEYIKPLREEVESIVAREGWSKASLAKMHKIDSFLKECQRLVGISIRSLPRKAMKDFTFSDGTFIPKGISVMASSRALHLDDKYYANPHAFNPFRFSDIRDEEGKDTRHQYVSTSMDYLPFGHGKYACPGRFFVANELKSMLAHLVMTYDVKLEDNATQPQWLRMDLSLVPDPAAKVMFRRRTH